MSEYESDSHGLIEKRGPKAGVRLLFREEMMRKNVPYLVLSGQVISAPDLVQESQGESEE